MCERIDTKKRRLKAEQDRVSRWAIEGSRFAASIERSKEIIKALDREISYLVQERKSRARTGDRGVVCSGNGSDRLLLEDLREHIISNNAATPHKSSPDTYYDLEVQQGQREDALHQASPVDLEVEHGCDLDTNSTACSSEQGFSRDLVSSKTSHAETGENAAQGELFLILTEDNELRSLYQEAFHVMNVECFEQNFPRILKSYCADLNQQASNGLEKRTARFMKGRSKQRFITRRIREAYGPKDERAVGFLELRKQREEKLPLLERFLKGDHPQNEVANDLLIASDDESDLGAGYDYSDVRLVKDFMLGKALTRFQDSLRCFIDAQKSEEKRTDISSPEADNVKVMVSQSPELGYSVIEEVRVGKEATNRLREKKGDFQVGRTVPIHWQCKCGEKFSEYVVERHAGYAENLVKQCMSDADDFDVEKQQVADGLAETQNSSSIRSSADASSSRQPTLGTSERSSEVVPDGMQNANREVCGDGLWVLLCLPGQRCYKVRHICVKNARCNKAMYTQLHKHYHLALRPWLRWLTLQKLESVSFIRFHVYWRSNVNIETSDIGSLPPSTSKDYDFDRKAARPPILRTALTHFLQHPSHAPKGSRHLARMPKKLGGTIEVADDTDEEREGWGLYVREVVCWKKMSLAFGLIGTAALAFAVVWCQLHDGSIQDGFTVTGVLLAYGTILLGLIQVAVFQRSANLT